MKVLIVEDDAVHRAFLREVLVGTLPDCELIEAENGLVGERLAREHGSMNVVVDLQMPQRTGVDMARTLWRERPATSIMFWSNYADEAYVRGVSRIVPAGAAYGYVLKSASEERLGLALRSVFLEGQCVIDREIRSVQQKSADRSGSFTDVEYEILTDLALGLTDRLIAERRGISLRSVQNRLQQIYEKLGVYDTDGGSEAFNLRMRAVTLALLRRLLNRGSLEQAEAALQDWLKRPR
ncbi:two-component system response regulator [Aureimonas endophytica]|uniref:Two-component system response regulator n=1 Tax=Aureimonas endophytica TaxID=2027858 RepID=A0A917A3Q2_9HYPH|nr:response regulator transcription factor [Aureimonas endophytica]GGE22462.1 two-component system response regulator [Aureimonas endophytica]